MECSRPLPSLEPLYHYKLPNVPGKSSVALLVQFPPNGATPPHRHAGASVSAYVLEGRLLGMMNDDPMQTEILDKKGYPGLVEIDEEYQDVAIA